MWQYSQAPPPKKNTPRGWGNMLISSISKIPHGVKCANTLILYTTTFLESLSTTEYQTDQPHLS